MLPFWMWGIIILIGLGILIAVLIFIIRKKRKSAQENAEEMADFYKPVE